MMAFKYDRNTGYRSVRESIAAIFPVNETQLDYASNIQSRLAAKGIIGDVIFAQKDVKHNSLGKKIREGWKDYQYRNMVIVGDKEKEHQSVSWKIEGGQPKEIPLDQFIKEV